MKFKQLLISVIIFIAVILSGLSAGLSLSHVLEIPGKHALTASEFLKVHHTFYGGYAIFGAVACLYCSLAGLITGILLFKLNKPFTLNALIGAGGFIICLLIFAIFLNSYNQLIAGWNVKAPEGWQVVRNRWELSHTVVFIISAISFAAFVNAYNKLYRIKIVHVAR